MSRRDQKLVALPGANPSAKRPRDLRIDAFRGLALMAIFIDHVPGNPYEQFTSRNFGFSDAAEGFFVMSGIAAGIAYSGRFLPDALRRDGWWTAISPIWHRAWTLYLVHLFLTVWAIAIFAWGAATFVLPDLYESINLRQVFDNTGAALAGIPALTHQLGYVNILPAYAVLLFVLPLILLAGLRSPWLVVGVSFGLWFAAGLFRLNLPNFPNPGGWFFNPFSWQFIFVVGLMTGMALRRGERFVPKSPVLFWICAGWLVLVLAWMKIPVLGETLNHGMAWLGSKGAPFHIVAHDKTFLSLPRLLHILALAYVLSSLSIVERFCASALAAPLRLMGRQGLLVFSTGTVLALFCQVVLAAGDKTDWLPWVLPPLGIAAMLAVAWMRERSGALARARRKASRTPARDSVSGGLAVPAE